MAGILFDSHSSTSVRNQNRSMAAPQARARQRNGVGRQAPQTAKKTAARENSNPKVRALSDVPEYKDGTNANRTDAVDRVKPARDKIDEKVRGRLARAHRIQLKTITATQGLHTTKVATSADIVDCRRLASLD